MVDGSYYTEYQNFEDAVRLGMPAIVEVVRPEELEGTYKSSVYDYFPDKDILKIAMPSYKGRLIPLPEGSIVYVKLIDRGAIYAFRTTVISSGKDEEGFFVTYVRTPKRVRRVQRRRFKRVPLVLEGTYKLSEDDTPKKFLTKDFSAGGILMIVSEPLVVGQVILISLRLKDDLYLKDIKSKAVREAGKTPQGDYMYGVMFLNVDPKLEKKLVVFTFEQELKSRKKEGG